jgi:hypothetical protein
MELLTDLQARFAFVPRRPRVYLYRPAASTPAAPEGRPAPAEAAT